MRQYLEQLWWWKAVGSIILLCMVRKIICRHRMMLILEYISTHGTPSGALRECQPDNPRIAYRYIHTHALVTSTPGGRGPLQLTDHSGDAGGVVTSVADVPSRATLHISSFCMLWCMCGSHAAEANSKCGLTKRCGMTISGNQHIIAQKYVNVETIEV